MTRDMTDARKRLIKKRGHKCEICGYPGMIEVHHILPVKFGGNGKMDNLMLLCEKCHADAHGHIKRKYLDPNREHWKG